MTGRWGGGGGGGSVTAGDRGARGVSDAPRLSNQVHFFISSYPCPALQLADQQSAAVCFNQAAPPLLQTGPDYREVEGGGVSSPRHRGDGRGEAGDMLIQNMENGEEEELGGTESNLKGPESRPPVRSSLVGAVSAAFGNKPECLRL